MTSEIIERHIPCEDCGSSDAKCVYSDGHTYCFSCGRYNGREVVVGPQTYEYLPWRGVQKETFQFFDVKTKVNAEGEPIELGYRYPNGAYKIRSLREKHFWTKGDISKAGLFGRDKFAAGSHKYVTITEGELDALSLWQVLRSPVVSVQSSSTAARDCSVDRAYLNAFERVYLAFDADQPGRDAAAAVAKLFEHGKVYDVRFSNRKDANDFLQVGEGEELRNIWWNSKKYLPDTVVSSLTDFHKIVRNPVKQGISYPFPTLTKMTYGIRTGETVLLTAREKVGKTSLMHAIEYHILKETDDAVAAIYLEEPKQRHLQSLAGLELRSPAHLPDSGCTDDQICSALEKVIRRDDRLYLYSHFGSADPDVLLDTIRFLVSACGCRYVIFDHISMAVSGSLAKDERQTLDYLSSRLEMMVKELDFALLMVSHVNDEDQTRGSRWLTKVADIVINARRDTMSEDEMERRTIHLSVPFNRYCWMSGPAGDIVFDPETYTLTEKENVGPTDPLWEA